MDIPSNGVPPLSVSDYLFNSLPCELDGTELEQYLAIAMDDSFPLLPHEIFPLGNELNIESPSEGNKEKMNLSNKGIPSLSMPDYSFNSLPCEIDGTEVDQYPAIALDDTTAFPDHEMFPFSEELMSHDLFHIFPFDEELINDNKMSGQLNGHPEAETTQTVNDICVPGAQFCNEILLKNNPDQFLPSEQTLNLEGAEHVRVCGNVSSNHEALDGEKEKGLELVQLLLASGRLVGDGKYDDAARLLRKCENLSCQLGSPIQRLGYYISSALHERIQLQTLGKSNNAAKPIPDFAFNTTKLIPNSLLLYSYRLLPYIKVMQFTSVQAIIDVVGNARKIHIIDLRVGTGSHWTILMEYLAHRVVSYSSPALQLLKITAVGKNSEHLIEKGRRLHELAKSYGIPFWYNIVEIPNIEEIKEGSFTVKSGEALAVYAPVTLGGWLYDPVLLHNLLCIIRKLRPRIMVNTEIEAQHNSPSFMNRFSEVLFHHMAYFDMLDVILTDRNDIERVMHEELVNGSQIRNMLVYEGKERTIRHVRTDVWRSFFKQAGFTEKSFSFQAIYQARLLLGEYPSGKYYSLEPDGHAIILKWKGTPLIAHSAWSGF